MQPGLLMQQTQGLPCAEDRLLLPLLQHEADPAAQRGGRMGLFSLGGDPGLFVSIVAASCAVLAPGQRC